MQVKGAVGRFLGLAVLLFALRADGQPYLDQVVADFQSHVADITNAEATYTYTGQKGENQKFAAVRQVTNFVGHWLYANGKELIDFRADKEALANMDQDAGAKTLREGVSQRIFLYNSRKDYTIVYNPLTQSAQIQKGRKVRGWPPSDFFESAYNPFGQTIVGLIKGNKTAKLVTAPKKPDDPVVIGFELPLNPWMYEISLLPSKGYRPVKIQISIDKGYRTMVSDIELVLRNGVWFPASVEYQDKCADEKLDNHVTWMCTDIRVNEPSFDVSRLDLKLQKGTTVTDLRNGKTVVLNSDEEARSFIASLDK